MRGSITLAVALGAFAVIASARAARAQDPVIKPTTSTTRLALPTRLSAQQLPDGRIMVRWARMAGAVAYQVTRSVPPAAATVITPNPTDTVWYDRDVVAGKTYYYVIAGIDDAGTLGLKAGTQPVTATRSAGTSIAAPAAPASLVAALSSDGKSVIVSGTASIPSGSGELRFERADVATLAWIPVGADGSAPYSFLDQLYGVAPGTRLRWRARVYDSSNGMLSEPTMSNELTIASVTTSTTGGTTGGTTSGTTGSTTGPTTSTPTATPATGSTTFTVAPALSLAVGASSSLASLGGTRWVSMNEGVASVDASGLVTGRAAGTTQIVSLTIASDGSLRVATVRVTVQ